MLLAIDKKKTSLLFSYFSLANMNYLGTSSFIGEFLILVRAFQRNSLVATLATFGMILGVAYNCVIFENFKPKFFQKN